LGSKRLHTNKLIAINNIENNGENNGDNIVAENNGENN